MRPLIPIRIGIAYNIRSSGKELKALAELKPCLHCELELPLSAFERADSPFCEACTEQIVSIIKSKYNAIEAAHFRAKLRRRSRAAMDELRRKLS